MSPSPPADNIAAPFISQIEVSPLLSCQTTSSMPSPLKSPVPTTDQFVGMFPIPAVDATCTPFMNQMAVLPVASRQRMSLLPSPLKSAIPTTDHVTGGTFPRPPADETRPPLSISQTARLPDESSHKMSP